MAQHVIRAWADTLSALAPEIPDHALVFHADCDTEHSEAITVLKSDSDRDALLADTPALFDLLLSLAADHVGLCAQGDGASVIAATPAAAAELRAEALRTWAIERSELN